ncbi:MAG: UDP-N-acetylmuramoyl-L-alanine--D-glutamate ligase [Clostridiales bacterium]|nr:UDP-N-acetylmuramoyl-L-alanine--D-glutamate ligase [Clostridiales bacterium]
MNEKLSVFAKTYRAKKAVLLGLGVSNIAAAEFLSDIGMHVTARDKNRPDDSVLDKMRKMNIDVIFGGGWLDGIDADIALRSPGIRPDAVLSHIGNARLTSEIELFCELCPCKLITVTGSDGKTTTTTLISKMLEREYAGTQKRVFLGGNIGTPLLPIVKSVAPSDIAVLELSSFQLMTMNFSPCVSVMTNVSPNHLNWHTDFDEYVAAKKRIFENQGENSVFVTNADNGITAALAAEARTKVRLFSCEHDADACYSDGQIFLENEPLIPASDIKIRGTHNAQNFMAACLAVEDFVSRENMIFVAREFVGVRHRCELVLESGGVKFYNSSIDTSPTRTAAALSALDGRAIVILGGYDKHIPCEPLIPTLCEKTKAIVGTGQTGKSLCDMTAGAGYAGKIEYIADFDSAVKFAASLATRGDNVILSPAAASFDSFKNFEERGDKFCEIIKNMYK